MEHEGRAHGSAGTPPRPTEDEVTKFIERYTANIPSSMLLGIAVGAMGLALVSQLSGRGKWGNFIAQWVPTIIMMGVYNKLVKVAGHDEEDRGARRASQAIGISNRPISEEEAQQRHLPPRGQGVGLGTRTAV
jgi:hypothetical protein